MGDAAAGLFLEARALHQRGRWAEARHLYLRLLQSHPNHFDALHLAGVLALQCDEPARAVDLIARAIRVNPGNAAAHMHLGNGLLALQQREAALACYERAIELKPVSPDAWFNRGNALRDLEQREAALISYERAIALAPGDARAYTNRALVLSDLKRFAAAVTSCEQALAIEPDNPEAHVNRGNALRDLQRCGEAVASFDRAIALRPGYAAAYNNRGLAQSELGRTEAALADFNQCIAVDAGFTDAYFNRANLLRDLQQLGAALVSYEQALARNPTHAEAHVNRGVVLAQQGERAAALASYDRALSLKVDFAAAHSNRGAVLVQLRRYEEAIGSFDRALELDEQLSGVYSARAYARLQICEWRGWEEQAVQLAARIEAGAAENPLCVMALSGSARLQQRAARNWVRRHCPPDGTLGAIGPRGAGERLRVGYFSADFRTHPVAVLAAQLFETHDRSRFETVGFSFGADTGDEMRRRLERGFERFIDVRGQSDRQIAQLARSLQIDIAVDLGGFTQDSRPGIFALRAAPCQVSYLGYPGTMGAPYMDYLLGDGRVIPAGSEGYYDEQIVYLPDSYLPHDSTRGIAVGPVQRAAQGLPEGGVVFCCFNNSYKISPRSFAGWMRILQGVAGSVLWLSGSNPSAVRNLQREAQSAGVAAQRLIFASHVPAAAEHLGRHGCADLFLDTLPYNAHTTAADALWAGLPVLTCEGESFAGRVAGSVLQALGLSELIAPTAQRYEELAIELGREPQRLAGLKQRLAANRLTQPLFDTPRLTRHLEAAYVAMHARQVAGIAPAALRVHG